MTAYIRSWKKPEKRVLTYFAKYLNILCHLSLDTLPFMSTYFFGGVLGEGQGYSYCSPDEFEPYPEY